MYVCMHVITDLLNKGLSSAMLVSATLSPFDC